MQDAIGNSHLLGRELQGVEKGCGVVDRKRANFGQGAVPDAYIAGFLPQAAAAAIRAKGIAAILGKKYSNVQFVFLCFKPLEETAHAAEFAFTFDDGALLAAR